MQVSLAALLPLLRSDKLKARSENSVLMMADAWVLNSPAGKSCDVAQLRQVAEAVRMDHLSITFLHTVVPRLSWVSLSDKERECLSLYVAYKASRNSGKASAFIEYNADCLSVPSNWFDSPLRPPPQNSAAPLVMKWELTKEELADVLSTGETYADRIYFYGGFSLQLVLVKEEDTSGQWFFCHYVDVRRGGCDKPLPLQCVSSSMVSMRVSQRSAVGGWSSPSVSSVCMRMDYFSYDFPLMVPEGDSLNTMALVEPYLVNGKLSVVCSLTSCD